MNIQYYTLTSEEYDKLLTDAMNVTVTAMVLDGLVDAKIADQWQADRACICVRQTGCWRAWMKKIWPNLKQDEAAITIVRAGAGRT